MRLKNFLLVAVTVCALAGWPRQGLATPPYGDPDQPYDKIPGTWETAHVPWARPLAGGKLNVLVILPYPTARDAVELAQRLDLDYTVIMTAGRASWDQGWYEGANATPLKGSEATMVLEALTKKRLSLANEYDAIVLGGVSWAVLPESARDLLLQHVARGAGLVYVSPNRQALTRWGNAGGGPAAVADKPVAAADLQFAALFQQNEDPAVATRIVDSMPLDCLPLKVLTTVAEFKELKPLQSLSRAQSPVCITTSSHGKGRVMGLHYFDAELNKANNLTSLVPSVPYDRVTYDYLYALLAKGVLWSAGRGAAANLGIEIHAPATELKAPAKAESAKSGWEAKTPAVVIARKDLGQAKLSLSVAWPATPVTAAAATLEYRLQDDAGTWVEQKNLAVDRASGKRTVHDIVLPQLGRGNYFITLRLLDETRRVIDFAAKSFRVEDPLRISQLTLDKDAYPSGDAMRGKVTFNQPLTAGQTAVATAVDTWGRTVQRCAVVIGPDRTGGEFVLPVELPLCRLWDVVCEVQDSGGAIDSATTWVGLPDWTFNEFICMEWLGPTPGLDYKGRCMTASMRRFGQNAGMFHLIYGSERLDLFERSGIMNVFYAEHLGQRHVAPNFGGTADPKAEYSGACLSEFSRMARCIADTGKFPDPKAYPYNADKTFGWMDAQWFNNRVESRYRPSARFGSPMYVLNSENELAFESAGRENSCFCPLCTSRFQEWCRQAYGDDIKKVNTEWGSELKSFAEVRGILLTDAVEKSQLPRWVDFRYFMRSYVFTQFHIDWTDMIRRYVPQAKTAIGALGNFDFTRLREALTSNAASAAGDMGETQLELQQSFSGDTSYILGEGNTLRWDPEFRTPLDNVRYPWKYLFLGCQGLKIGTEGLAADCLGGHSYLTADYSEPLPFFKRISDEVRLLQNGTGTLVLTAKPVRSRVAILWSPYNHYISRLFPFQDNGFSGGSHANVSAGGGAIEDGLMLMQSLRMRPTFIGPQDLVVGELEKKGYRALLLPYSKGVSLAEADAIKRFVKAGGLVIADNEPGVCTEHGRVLPAGEGRLKELFPVLDRKNLQTYGKGTAFYLAGELNGYAARLARCDYTGSDSVAVALQDRAGVRPEVELITAAGLPRRDTLMSLFRHGSATLVGLLRTTVSDGRETAPTTMVLQQPYHIWDMREKRYCGFADRLAIELSLYPKCYALLPANPVSLQIVPEVAALNQGAVLSLKGQVTFSGEKDVDALGQVVHVTVFGPELQELECYTRNVVFSGRQFQLKLPVSYSEPPGRYTVVVEHAITGTKAQACFDVEKKQDDSLRNTRKSRK